MHLLAPAKINLHLRVAPLTADGFHPLSSWMCTVGLFDTLTIETRHAGPAESAARVALACDDPTLACDQSNLVARSAAAMLRAVGEDGLAAGGSHESLLSIHLQKRIPTGGGLGGGSSDAASVVMGLAKLWGLHWPVRRLSEIAATLGSDVAFFCHGPSSVCTGRGQIVRPIARPVPGWAVLFLPPISVPTGPVYRRFDELLTPSQADALRTAVEHEPDWNGWTGLTADELLPMLVNDLERPAFDLHPLLDQIRRQIEQTLGRVVRMSGSGSSLFTLYDDRPAADAAAELVTSTHSIRSLSVPLAPLIDDDLAT